MSQRSRIRDQEGGSLSDVKTPLLKNENLAPPVSSPYSNKYVETHAALSHSEENNCCGELLTSFVEALNNFLLQKILDSKYFLRLFSLLIVAYNFYWDFYYWFSGDNNYEKLILQKYLMESCYAFLSSFLFMDHLECSAEKADERLLTNNPDLSETQNAQYIAAIEPYNIFVLVVIAIGGGATLFFSHLDMEGHPKNSWLIESLTPAIWCIVCIAGYRLLRAMTKDVVSYQNENFPSFIRRIVIPSITAMVVLQLFSMAAMVFEASTAIRDPNLHITNLWSAGVGCSSACFLVVILVVIYFYSFGAGHVKLDFEDFVNTPDEGTKVNSKYHLGVRVIKRSIFIGLFGLLVCFSLLYTTFDCGKYYAFLYITIAYYFFVGMVVLYIRPKSPAHLDALLKATGLKYHAFISHAQQPGGDQVECIARELKYRGLKVWRDMDINDLTGENMKRGIEESLYVIAFITKDVKGNIEETYVNKTNCPILAFDERGESKQYQVGEFVPKSSSLFRPFCEMEINHAIEKEKKLIPIMEVDARHYGFSGGFSDMSNNLPNNLSAKISKADVITYERRADYADAFYSQLFKRIISAGDLTTRKRNKFNFDYFVAAPNIAPNESQLAHDFMNFMKEKKIKYCTASDRLSDEKIGDLIENSKYHIIFISEGAFEQRNVLASLYNLKKRKEKNPSSDEKSITIVVKGDMKYLNQNISSERGSNLKRFYEGVEDYVHKHNRDNIENWPEINNKQALFEKLVVNSSVFGGIAKGLTQGLNTLNQGLNTLNEGLNTLSDVKNNVASKLGGGGSPRDSASKDRGKAIERQPNKNDRSAEEV